MLDLINYDLAPGLSNNKLRKNGFSFGCYRKSVYKDTIEFRLYIDLEEQDIFYQVFDSDHNQLYVPYYNREYGNNKIVKEIDRKINRIIKTMMNQKILKKAKEEEKNTMDTETIKIKYFADIEPIVPIQNGDWIDLRAAEDVHIKKGEFRLISLGVGMKLPDGYEAHIVPRSSTYKNFKIIQSNHQAVIDNMFCGPQDCWRYPAIAMEDTVIHKNDRICQFRIMKKQPEIHFETVKELSGKSRGGFGSTGKN